MRPPGYWRDESSGVLAPVVERYLRGDRLSRADVTTMRAYLRQWIECPLFVGDEVEDLRATVDAIATAADVRQWVALAIEAGVDPL